MAGNLTDAGEQLALDTLAGLAPAAPTGPLRLALVTVIGTDAAAGTEVVGGTYARQAITLSSSATRPQSNTNAISFGGMPACTVVGFDIWDSATVPKRLWWIPAAVNKVVNAGDTVTVAVNAVTLDLD